MNSSLQLSLFGISLLLAGNLAVSAGIGAGVYIGGLGLLFCIIAFFIGGKKPKNNGDNKDKQ